MREYISYRDGFNMFEWSAKKLFEVQLQGVEGQTVTIDNQENIRVIIQENTNPLNELKEDRKILIPSEVSVCRGSVVNWKGEKWIIINDVSPTDDNGVYIKAKIQKSMCEIKWLDKYNKLHIYSVLDTNQTLYSLGINDNKLPTVDGMLKLTLPDDKNTKQIQRGQRFIYKNRFIYEVTFIDLSMNGLINLILKEVELSPNDNKELGIADYYNRPQWSVKIKENNISIARNNSLQLHAMVIKDGIVVDEEIEWLSSNPSIAIIDNQGNLNALANGNVTIYAKLKGNNDYFDSIECVISDSPSSNSYIIIEGDDSIEWGMSKKFKSVKYVNGIQYPASFIFTIDYNDNPMTLCDLQIIDETSCKIVANADQLEGEVKLLVVNSENTQEYSTKTIQIKGFW